MTEQLRVTITDELVDKAFEVDESLRELINPGVVKMFNGSTFIQTETGGWRGEGGNYGKTTALGRVLEVAIKPSDEEIVQ